MSAIRASADRIEQWLPPERAAAQKRREEDLLGYLGLARLREQEKADAEIAASVRGINSKRAGLKLKTLSAADRNLMKMQIKTRAARVA
jgi:hypothetical protein